MEGIKEGRNQRRKESKNEGRKQGLKEKRKGENEGMKKRGKKGIKERGRVEMNLWANRRRKTGRRHGNSSRIATPSGSLERHRAQHCVFGITP